MIRPRIGSLRTRLLAMLLVTSVGTLLLACVAFMGLQLRYSRAELLADLASLADVVGATSTAAVSFEDRAAVTEILGALARKPHVVAATVHAEDAAEMGAYRREGWDGDRRSAAGLLVTRPIVLDGVRIGTITLVADPAAIYARWRTYASAAGLILATCAGLALLLSVRQERRISSPILMLAGHARLVSESRDYSVRAVPAGDDEIKMLCARFNDMLAQIQSRDEALQRAHDELESRVHERTHELRAEIAERQLAEQRLVHALDAAETASRAKSSFLANMSHELRTPLNAIIGYSEMLEEDAVDRADEQAARDLERIRKAGRHLLLLINDVLDLSKIESGRLVLDVERVDLASSIREAVEMTSGAAAKNGNAFEVGPLDRAGTLQADAMRLRQVLVNLLANAHKFTSGGVVRVDVRRDVRDGRPWALVAIRDSGIGISPEQQRELFSDFFQADVSTSRRFGGTGLGLAISRRLCRLMGGDIEIESAVGAGSTFTVCLPAEEAGEASGDAAPRGADAA